MGADVLEAMHSAQGVCGLWMLAGLCEVRVGLPVHVYLCEDTTTQSRPTLTLSLGGLGWEARRKRSAGKVTLVSASAAPREKAAIAEQTTPASPQAPQLLARTCQAPQWRRGVCH